MTTRLPWRDPQRHAREELEQHVPEGVDVPFRLEDVFEFLDRLSGSNHPETFTSASRRHTPRHLHRVEQAGDARVIANVVATLGRSARDSAATGISTLLIIAPSG